MRDSTGNSLNVAFVFSCLLANAGCAHNASRDVGPNLPSVKLSGPIELRLKAEMGRTESVAYLHRSTSDSYEDRDVRKRTQETVSFVSQAETVKVDAETGTFTQLITVPKKEGTLDLHDFAMPEPGEKLEVTADTRGRIVKSGQYPPNSLFYVPPVSLPEGKVSIGDTWTMQAAWLSLESMIPYQLDMVSILKGVYRCGDDECADIEISGDVGFQGALNMALSFKSSWRGRMYFAMKAGTVVWSRVDSEERMLADNVRRDVSSCLESVLQAPANIRLPGVDQPKCDARAARDSEVSAN